MANYVNFAKWFDSELKLRGWSHKDFHDKSGLSAAQISRIISGDRLPGVASLKAIAKAFGMEVQEVFELAGVLPPDIRDGKKLSVDQKEWLAIFDHMKSEGEKQELIDIARLFARRLREQRGDYDGGS